MKIIYIVLNYNEHLPQYSHETNSLDLVKLSSCMSDKSEYEIKYINVDLLANSLLANDIEVDGVKFIFCSSQIQEYKSAIIDVAFEVERRGGELIPSLDFYVAHENKYFQELHKARVGIETPSSELLTCSLSESLMDKGVVKPSYGFGSKGISLQNNNVNIIKSCSNLMTPYINIERGFFATARNVAKFLKYKGLYPSRFGKVVVQDFIPELKHDWKVLVFGNKAFALKRFVRNGDFRASGSGKFDFDEIASEELIKFSISIREKLNVPFVSLDVAEGKNKFSIIEYQAVHFGLVTCYKAKHYYQVDGESFSLIPLTSNVVVEDVFVDSVIKFLDEK